jgi:hypothetical protein
MTGMDEVLPEVLNGPDPLVPEHLPVFGERGFGTYQTIEHRLDFVERWTLLHGGGAAC